jgi:hypothetical protein
MKIDLDKVLAAASPADKGIELEFDGKIHTLRPLTREKIKALEAMGTAGEGESNDDWNVRTITELRSLFAAPPDFLPEQLPDDLDARQAVVQRASAVVGVVAGVAMEVYSTERVVQRASEETLRQLDAQRGS